MGSRQNYGCRTNRTDLKFDTTDQAAVADLPGPAARATIEPPGLEVFNRHPDNQRLAAIVPHDQKDYNIVDSNAPILLREGDAPSGGRGSSRASGPRRGKPQNNTYSTKAARQTPLSKTPHAVDAVLLEPAIICAQTELVKL